MFGFDRQEDEARNTIQEYQRSMYEQITRTAMDMGMGGYTTTNQAIKPIKIDGNLEELVNECCVVGKVDSEKIESAKAKLNQLKELGFVSAINSLEKRIIQKERTMVVSELKYIVITTDKIKNFLNKKANLYNEKAKSTDVVRIHAEDGKIYATTCHSGGYQGIGKFVWDEVKVEHYPKLPPDNVLKTFQEHKDKKVFDYFTIASVNAIKDPLLLGRINGVEDRFFIAQWGDDVSLDDVI